MLGLAMRQFTPEEMAAIHRAFCRYVGSEERWAELARKGATDDELVEFIKHEMWIGATYGPNRIPEEHRVSPPRIWLGDDPSDVGMMFRRSPTLSGSALLAVAREMFGVGYPVPEGALRLL